MLALGGWVWDGWAEGLECASQPLVVGTARLNRLARVWGPPWRCVAGDLQANSLLHFNLRRMATRGGASGQKPQVCLTEVGRETKTPVAAGAFASFRGPRISEPRPNPHSWSLAQAGRVRPALSAGGCDGHNRGSRPAPTPLPALRPALHDLLQLRPRPLLRLAGVQ
jgi:hypothetical protein